MKLDLPEDILQMITEELARHPNLSQAKIFGSRVLGYTSKYSDIDIALYGDLSDSEISLIAIELDDLHTVYKYDVIHYETINTKELKDDIDNTGVTIYCRK